MKPLLLCLLVLAWAMPALAQDAATLDAGAKAVERQRIEAARTQATVAFDAEDRECYKRFAVSGCLKDVQSRRRAMLADLRKQEAMVHERELAQQAQEQRQRNVQKALERQLQEADMRVENSVDRAAEKRLAQREKQAAHAAKAQASAPVAVVPATAAGPTPADQASSRDSFAKKQLDAEKKRQEIARRLAEKSGKRAVPLPVPP